MKWKPANPHEIKGKYKSPYVVRTLGGSNSIGRFIIRYKEIRTPVQFRLFPRKEVKPEIDSSVCSVYDIGPTTFLFVMPPMKVVL